MKKVVIPAVLTALLVAGIYGVIHSFRDRHAPGQVKDPGQYTYRAVSSEFSIPSESVNSLA